MYTMQGDVVRWILAIVWSITGNAVILAIYNGRVQGNAVILAIYNGRVQGNTDILANIRSEYRGAHRAHDPGVAQAHAHCHVAVDRARGGLRIVIKKSQTASMSDGCTGLVGQRMYPR